MKISNRKKKVEQNWIRRFLESIKKHINIEAMNKGYWYMLIHTIIIFIIGFIMVFSSSTTHLTILLIIVSLDAFSIVMLHECPLTIMEKKYLGISSCDERNHILKKSGIVYKCNHNYEKQIELLINIWCIIATKILLILFLKTTNLKLFDLSGIYCPAP